MSEKLEIYDLEGNLLEIKDRKKAYSEFKDEFKKTGKVSKQVKTIRLLLMNSSGRIYLQKRSKIKEENSGLYDKTVGGHVSAGDTFDMTVIRECAEELGFPAAVLTVKEFDKAVKVTDLSIVGLFKEVDYMKDFNSTRILNKGKFVQPFITKMYVGYYNGPIKFVDGESSGIEVFSLEELEKELEDVPEKFTEDIKFMVKKYEEFLKPIK